MQILNPELARQWQNGDLTPGEIKAGSGKKAWWRCEKGHEWEAVIRTRKNGVSCPICRKENRSTTEHIWKRFHKSLRERKTSIKPFPRQTKGIHGAQPTTRAEKTEEII